MKEPSPETASPFPHLKSISLLRFGKFIDRTFPLSETTLFFGRNEAGKTTLFDAFFQALCRPGANRKAGKLLRSRYGEEMKVELAVEGGEKIPEIPEEEFRNLFSIRSGALEIEMEERSRWVEHLKSSIFTGGVDPSVIIESLEKRCSDNRTLLHNKKNHQNIKERDRLVEKLESRLREKEELFRRESRLKALEEQAADFETKRKELTNERNSLDEQIAREEKIRLRQNLNSVLELIAERSSLEREIEELRLCAGEDLPEFDALEKTLAETRGERHHIESSLASKREEAKDTENSAIKTKKELEHLDARARQATLLLDRIAQHEDNPVWIDVTTWKKSFLWGAGLSFASALFAFLLWMFAFRDLSFLSILPPVLLLPGLALLSLARRNKKIRDPEETQRFHKKLLAEWISGTTAKKDDDDDGGGGGGVRKTETEFPQDNPAALKLYLQKILVDRDSALRSESDLNGRIQKIASEIAEYERALKTIREEIRSAEDSRTGWLGQRGLASRDEFVLKHNRYIAAKKRRKELEERLLRDHGGESIDGIKIECDRKLRLLDEEGIPARSGDENLSNRLNRERKNILEELDHLESRNREIIAKKEGESGEIKGSLEPLTEEIRTLQESLGKIQVLIERHNLDKRAAALTLDIFKEIRQDSGLLLSSLTRELEESFSAFLPELREVSMDRLDPSGIQVCDEGGDLRPLDHLSAGTRDTFTFAMRLAFAGKVTGNNGGLLILDEPFLSLDHDRETRSLEMLREFRERKGWQILFFTKEKGLLEKIEKVFPETLIHDLNHDTNKNETRRSK